MRQPLQSLNAGRFLSGILLCSLLGILAPAAVQSQQSRQSRDSLSDRPIRIMLLTGQSSIYHDWTKSSPIIRDILLETGLFDVDVVTTPAATLMEAP